jgi:excisionase family DNA binding protein
MRGGYLTTRQAAKQLGCSRQHATHLVRSGKIKGKWDEQLNRYFIPTKELKKYVNYILNEERRGRPRKGFDNEKL